MKLYKNLVNAVASTVQEIFLDGIYADKAIERKFKQNPQWGSRDRKFIAEAVYDIVRHYRLYETLAESKNNFWFMTAIWLILKKIEIPDWQEFKHLDEKRILRNLEPLKENKVVFLSYPDWLWDMAKAELGELQWEAEALDMNKQAEVYLRLNPLKTNRAQLIQELAKEKIEAIEIKEIEEALMLNKRQNVFKTNLFKNGFFEVQDAGSQLISKYLDPKSDHLVIDACAGAGGKSLHLAAIMKNKGKIISMDVAAFKLDELKKRARRAGISNIETKVIEKDKTIKSLSNKADRLLLDVPCSGLGVLKRNPDSKWKLSPESLDATKKLQANILSEYSKMLKVDGQMVYSTCSILPSENQEQIKKFIFENSNFEVLNETTVLPSHGYDGFYMALIKRKN
jgi:16S rRNA (cytosine967-C5)-methyltransferase